MVFNVKMFFNWLNISILVSTAGVFTLRLLSPKDKIEFELKLIEHEFYKLISGSAVGNSVYAPLASLRKTRNTSVQVIYLFLSKLTMILTLFLATAGDQRLGFDRMQLHEEKQHIQGAEPLHQAHALLVPQLEPHKNIFSLTDNPQQVSSSLPFFFSCPVTWSSRLIQWTRALPPPLVPGACCVKAAVGM